MTHLVPTYTLALPIGQYKRWVIFRPQVSDLVLWQLPLSVCLTQASICRYVILVSNLS